MKYLLSLLMAITLISAPNFAEAKRFGGGFSLGKSYSMPKKAAPAPTPSKSATTASSKPTQGAKPSMGGLLGGMLAGGLLGAMLFGGAFEGIQIMDILLIALVIFVLVRMFGGRRAPAIAGGYGAHQAPPEMPMARNSEAVLSSGGWGGLSAGLQQVDIETPDWFDAKAFVAGAEAHFKTLQSAWDRQEWSEIASYTSPELLVSLKKNREMLPDVQNTEVVSVIAELGNFQEDADQFVVSMLFHGWIREDGKSDATEFSEVWHLSRAKESVGGDWFIVGIEQY